MKKRPKNPHAVALGRLGGLVRNEAKQRANRTNGRKGGLVRSRKKRVAARRNTRSSSWGPSPPCSGPQEPLGALHPGSTRSASSCRVYCRAVPCQHPC